MLIQKIWKQFPAMEITKPWQDPPCLAQGSKSLYVTQKREVIYQWLIFSEHVTHTHIQNIGFTTDSDISVFRVTLTAVFRLCCPFCYMPEYLFEYCLCFIQSIFTLIFVHLQNHVQAIILKTFERQGKMK